mgnify:CR=1 FL=1
MTASYEKLEFLGDAVLDYLVTCYIYTNTDADPGRLTDIRSALVCNNMFASLLVDKQLHGNILYSAPFVRVSSYSFIHSFIHLFIHSFIHSLIHSSIHVRIPIGGQAAARQYSILCSLPQG